MFRNACRRLLATVKSAEGQRVPSVTFKTRTPSNEWADVTTDELFSGRTVVVFSLPGAFTPTCSTHHAPRYDELAAEFRRAGVDEIACVSVNDGFVMARWAQELGIKNVRMIPDGNGEFTKGLGALADFSAVGFGPRSWRYSALVRDGVVEKQFVEPDEPGDPFKVSDADTMLTHLTGKASVEPTYLILSKPGCPFCAKAREALEKSGKRFTEIVATQDVLRAASGMKTWPAVFADGKLIGGSDDLVKSLE
jgi:peroxiredoxin/glutaredoxin